MQKNELFTDSPEETKRLSEIQIQYLVRQILSYIEAHCTEKLTCKQIANEFSYHPNSLNRIMRRKQGCSLHDMIIRAKINAAIRLLTETNASITDIAYQVGFYDRAHFAKTFCEVTGQSPAAFRETQVTTHKK